MTDGESELQVRRALQNSRMLSSDVSAAYDPMYADVFEKRSSAFFGKGLVFNKFTGSRGKSGSNDANAEYLAQIRKALDTDGVAYQFAELGKVDVGGGGTIAMIVGMIACYNIGNQFAGESIYKVWTQESFPVEARASMQGFINGFSRFCCGLFALVTPYLVAGDRIHTTMYGFAGIVLISAIAGTRMIMLQKKHGVGQM